MTRDPLAVVIEAALAYRWTLAATGHRDQAAEVDRAVHATVHTTGRLGDRWLTVPEAAAELDVDPSTVRRWAATGKLPATRRGSRWLIDRTRCARL